MSWSPEFQRADRPGGSMAAPQPDVRGLLGQHQADRDGAVRSARHAQDRRGHVRHRRSSGFREAHNLVINEDTGFAYAVGSDTCSGGLHMINIQNPTSPVSAGCYSNDGYTHDTEVVVYHGPDNTYVGSEIAFSCNEDTLTIASGSGARGGRPELTTTERLVLSEN